jgi:hypothetical protein
MTQILKMNRGLWIFLFVSFAGHFLFLNIFTFRFSENELSVKPFLFSLGTIIPRSDFLEFKKTMYSFEPNFEKIKPGGRSNLKQLITVGKPSGTTTSREDKTALKSTFPVALEDKIDERKDNVSENRSFYEPLRLP